MSGVGPFVELRELRTLTNLTFSQRGAAVTSPLRVAMRFGNPVQHLNDFFVKRGTLLQRTTRTRGHASFPSAAASMRRSRD